MSGGQAWTKPGMSKGQVSILRGLEESMLLNFRRENKEALAALVCHLALWKCTWSIWEGSPVLPVALSEVQSTQSSS